MFDKLPIVAQLIVQIRSDPLLTAVAVIGIIIFLAWVICRIEMREIQR